MLCYQIGVILDLGTLKVRYSTAEAKSRDANLVQLTAWRFDFIVNGHIESRYSVTTGKWTLPKLVKDPMLRVHGLSPALNYGTCRYIFTIVLTLQR